MFNDKILVNIGPASTTILRAISATSSSEVSTSTSPSIAATSTSSKASVASSVEIHLVTGVPLVMERSTSSVRYNYVEVNKLSNLYSL